MAGLLGARTVLDHYERVTLIDRDDIPARPQPRGGVPQGRHAHGLLAQGRQILEEMFPGLTDDLTSRGAVLADVGREGVWCFTPRPLAKCDAGLQALLVSRSLLEWYVRERVLARPAVTLREDASVLDLAFSADESRVVGVIVQDRDGGSPCLLPADLVIDASGRASRTPEWLERRGYEAPVEEVRRVDKRYTTYRVRAAADSSTPLAMAVAAQPGLDRSGIMLAEEGGSRVVSLMGRLGERPPVAWPELVAWAHTLASPRLGEALARLEPLGEGATYRFPANRRRHYERLSSFPEGLVVIGDALCAFDPSYGQGMTVAAIEAVELGRCLELPGPGLATRFHHAASHVIDTPWTIAVGGIPDEEGRVPLRSRVMGRYLARLLRAGSEDPEVAAAFLRVNHLVDTPVELLRPGTAVRVLRHALGHRPGQRTRPAAVRPAAGGTAVRAASYGGRRPHRLTPDLLGPVGTLDQQERPSSGTTPSMR
jgi:2-polyprenyl-6-methoxyphenol hydroxylase-like FAD-dependent oxidoreductase